MTLAGLGVGLIFIKASVLLFVTSLLSGIGVGLLVAALIPRRRGQRERVRSPPQRLVSRQRTHAS